MTLCMFESIPLMTIEAISCSELKQEPHVHACQDLKLRRMQSQVAQAIGKGRAVPSARGAGLGWAGGRAKKERGTSWQSRSAERAQLPVGLMLNEQRPRLPLRASSPRGGKLSIHV